MVLARAGDRGQRRTGEAVVPRLSIEIMFREHTPCEPVGVHGSEVCSPHAVTTVIHQDHLASYQALTSSAVTGRDVRLPNTIRLQRPEGTSATPSGGAATCTSRAVSLSGPTRRRTSQGSIGRIFVIGPKKRCSETASTDGTHQRLHLAQDPHPVHQDPRHSRIRTCTRHRRCLRRPPHHLLDQLPSPAFDPTLPW